MTLDALLADLERWAVIRSPALREAIEELDWDRLLPPGPGAAGSFHAPSMRDGHPTLSPRLSVLLASLLEIGNGDVVSLPLPRPAILEAITLALGARVFDPLHTAAATRALEIGPVTPVVPLGEDAFTLRLSLGPHDEHLTKIIHAAEGPVTMNLDEVRLGEDATFTVRRLLVVEAFCRRALTHQPRTREDETFAGGVDEVWDPPGARAPAPRLKTRLEAARTWFHLAYLHQFTAHIEDAVALYDASIDAHPTAEAHTFRGWALAMAGDVDGAIESCRRAIRIDAAFGNPYNDIGAYLLDQGRAREAIEWLDRALAAERYASPHFALTNRGRALITLGRKADAKKDLQRALELEPDYEPARHFLSGL